MKTLFITFSILFIGNKALKVQNGNFLTVDGDKFVYGNERVDLMDKKYQYTYIWYITIRSFCLVPTLLGYIMALTLVTMPGMVMDICEFQKFYFKDL